MRAKFHINIMSVISSCTCSFRITSWLLLWLIFCLLFWLLFHVHLLFHHHHHFFLLWWLESIAVLVDDADEVGEEGIDAAGNIKGDHNLLLSGGLDETNTVVTSCYRVLLVEENKVDGGPDGFEGDADDNEHASNKESSSASRVVISEEEDGESRGNDKRTSNKHTDEPM